MAVHLHRCERTDALVARLAEVLSDPPTDPLAADVVVVPTRGIERFLSQGLAHRLGTSPGRADGVCARVAFPSPAALVELVTVGSGSGPSGGVDPWRPERAAWPLLAEIDDAAQQPWCRPLARHLGMHGDALDSSRRERRLAVSARLAGLFSSYGSQRPSLILDWAQGHDTDGAGGPLPEDLAWQPPLWRGLRARIGTPSPAERLDRACARVTRDPAAVDLPERISVFGATRLPADQLRVLAALGVHREVHLWLADASPVGWAALRGRPAARAGRPAAQAAARRADDSSAGVLHHPLLRSLGRDARELAERLADELEPATDEHLPTTLADGTLLGRLQNDLSADVDPTSKAPIVMAADDRSVSVHACHGVARQAEVLREALLGLLQADPTLQPRDILVMCPDLDTMAPLISAAFADPRPDSRLPDLRLRIADRTPEQANDVLAALDALLGLLTGRAVLSDVLDLIGRAPVRTRFDLDDDDLARIEELVSAAGVRWGLDRRTREEFQLGPVLASTWDWGLDRILLGVALSEEELALCGGVLPLDDVQGSDLAVVGALAEVVAQVRAVRDASLGAHPVTHWVRVLEAAITGLMDARGPAAWQVPHALAALAALQEAASPHGLDTPLRLADVRWLLRAVLAGRPTRANFRSGGLTVCGLVPMRSVPHRVVCLVGMDDQAFPRSVARDGDDVLARDPRIGERDPRSEDRQLLLDAIMAAVEHLLITYTGADDRTNEARPPCAPLGELLDVLDATGRAHDGLPARSQVVHRHPLQPFDPRNFEPGALGTPGPFSHDTDSLAAARAALQPRSAPPALLTGTLPVPPLHELSLAQLSGFLRSPAAAFLRTRLGLALHTRADVAPEALPITLDGLETWAVGDRALTRLSRGDPAEQVVVAERARGSLPPGGLGAAVLERVGPRAEAIATSVRQERGEHPGRQVPVALLLPSGRRVTGAVNDVHGESIVRGTYSRLRARHHLLLWPELLALSVAMPHRAWSATLVGQASTLRLRAPEPERAQSLLDELLDLYTVGMAAPLPLPADTSHAYATARRADRSIAVALNQARRCWSEQVRGRIVGEAGAPEHQLLHGPDAPVEVLLSEPADPAASLPGEATRFAVLARQLWDPILAAEVSG